MKCSELVKLIERHFKPNQTVKFAVGTPNSSLWFVDDVEIFESDKGKSLTFELPQSTLTLMLTNLMASAKWEDKDEE